MKGLRYAVGLLTRLPVGAPDDAARASSVPWYPVVGAGIGALSGLTAYGAGRILPDLVAGILAVAVSTAVTGALHLDGLADVFDGFVGGWDRDRRLEIMGDPRLGTYGAAALFLALALHTSLLAALAANPVVVLAAAAGGAVSRAVTVVGMGTAPVAAEGLGARHAAAATLRRLVVTGIVGVAAGAALGGTGLAALGAAVVAGAAIVGWARRAVGGITGDVLGAVQVTAELAFLGTIVGSARW